MMEEGLICTDLNRSYKSPDIFLCYRFYCSYYLFRSWGRVGTTIGGNKIEVL